MPSETYQPQKFKRSRSRHSRMIRRSLSLLALIVVFFTLTMGLNRLDQTTPRWARVWFPPFAVKEEPYVVNVSYRGRPQSADIEIVGTLKGDNGRCLGRLTADDSVPEGTGRGSVSFFVFQVPPDSNALSIQFSVASNPVLSDPKTELRPVIRSSAIPILPAGHKKVMRSYDLPDWQNVLLNAFEDGRWAPKPGDPTVIGWGITICYALTGLCCLYCTGLLDSRRAVPISQMFAWFWRLMAVVLISLAISKQLDVQLLLADFGRALAKNQGWYVQRRPVQIRFLALGVCLCLACLQGVRRRLRGAPRSTLNALLGVLILGVNAFVSFAMYLISLPSMDHVLAFSVARLSVGNGIEMLTILWIAASALLYNHSQRQEVSYIMQ
jgi:hypothetical protein